MGHLWLFEVFILALIYHHCQGVATSTQNLLGCGPVRRPSRYFPYSPGNYDYNSNSPGTCMLACSSVGYAYASVSAGQLCFCGISNATLSQLNLTSTVLCEVAACPGDNNLYCGDNDYELVYTSMGFLQSTTITLSNSSSPMALRIGQTYQFNLVYQGAVSQINYRIDFGDGGQTTWIPGVLNGITTVSHTFTKTGTFTVTVAARSLAIMTPIGHAMAVKVLDQMASGDITISCPNITATKQPLSCSLNVARGFGLTANINYNISGGIYQISDVPDTIYYNIGIPSVTRNPASLVSSLTITGSDIVILGYSTLPIQGRITSIQFFMRTSAPITIYWLRRSCSAPNKYCYSSNACGSCGATFSTQCTGSIFSTAKGQCLNGNSSQRIQSSRYSSVSFQIITSWYISTPSIGYQQISLSSSPNAGNITAMPGDILGFKSTDLAYESSDDGTEDYRCVSPTVSASSFSCSPSRISNNASAYRHLLQATVIQGVQISPNTQFDAPGIFNVQGTVRQTNLTSLSASSILTVVQGIDWIDVTGPSVINLNTMASIVATVYPPNATVSQFLWFINGNNTANSSNKTLNIMFSTVGTYIITCQAQNPLTIRVNTTTVSALDFISNFSLHAGNNSNFSTSIPMQSAQFILRIVGTNYACRINFDTSQATSQVFFFTYGYVPGSYLPYTYTQPGQYNVYGVCENGLNNLTYSLVHYVQYPITGLQMQERGTLGNTAFRLNFTISQGTLPQFRILFNGSSVAYTYNAQYQLIQTVAFNGQTAGANYSVEVYAWNYISTVYLADIFMVVTAMLNPQIRASTTVATFPGPILFEYTMDSGSEVTVSFSFGDSLNDVPVVCRNFGQYPMNQWNQCAGTNRTFRIPGTVTVMAEFSNAAGTVYKYLSVELRTSVRGMEVRTTLEIPGRACSAGFVDNRAIASFRMQAINGSIKPASNAQVMIIPDTINKPNAFIGPFNLTIDYFTTPASSSSGLSVIYNAIGNYTATFIVTNAVDSMNISCVVEVLSIIQQVYYSLSPPNWPLNDPSPFQASVFVVDPNPGPVTITWNFGDGTNSSRPRLATQPDQPDMQSRRYTALGTYPLTITVQGPTNVVVRTFSVVVQNPVQSFNVFLQGILSSNSQYMYSGSPVTIQFAVRDTSSPLATNSYVVIDFNDTSPLARNSVVNQTLPLNATYSFIAPGVYLVNVTVFNLVSTRTQIVTIGINDRFNNFAYTLCYQLPDKTAVQDDKCSLTPVGNVYYIPKQSKLAIYATWSNPSGVANTFEVQFRSGINVVFSQSLTLAQVINVSQITGTVGGAPLFRLLIDLENNIALPDGLYTVVVTPRNPIFSASYQLNIYIIASIGGLSVDDNNTVTPMNTPKQFFANYEFFSPISCLYVKYFDNSVKCFGDTSSCSSIPSDIRANLSACPLPISSYVYNGTGVTFSRSFNASRAWLNAYGWNMVTKFTAQAYFSFPLSSSDCGLPIIEFDVPAPIMRLARQKQRSESFSIIARTTITCAASLNNIKQWSISQCDTATERCYPTAALNALVASLRSATTSEIFIVAQTLPIGTYLFNHTVTMSSQKDFVAFEYLYVRIVSSDIRVNLLAGGISSINNGVAQSLVFTPGTNSIDPDSPNFNPNDWLYKYYCRLYGVASYPVLSGVELDIESTLIDPMNPSCFSSPGNTSFFTYGPNNNRSILYIQPRALKAYQSYEFKAVITNRFDSSRIYSGFALINVQEVDAAIISAECIIDLCVPNAEYQNINPTTQALISSKCLQGCDRASETLIEWKVYRGFRPGYPNDDIRWVLFTNMSNFDNILFYGRLSSNFTATSELFKLYSNDLFWKFESNYIVTTPSGVKTGSGAIRFAINTPPSNGTCTITPNNGSSATLFRLSCVNWIDPDVVTDYNYYARASANGTRVPIAFTRLSEFDMYLPIGDSSRNYELRVTVDISDSKGSIRTFVFPSIKVEPDTSAISNFIELAQSSSSQGQAAAGIQQILYGGDQNLASQVVLSLSQALNTMSSDTTDITTSSNVPAQNLFVSGLSSAPTTYPSTNTSANTTEAMSNYTEALNRQAATRDYAIQFLSNLSVTTVSSVKVQATAMKELTSSPSELTLEAVGVATAKSQYLINSLNTMAKEVTYEDVKLAVASITQVASNVIVAVNSPLLGRSQVLNLDYERANTLPVDYEADLENYWSNVNNFADGGDFSQATLEKNRNAYYQQQGSNNAIQQVDEILSKTVNVLNYHLNTGQTHTVEAPSVSMVTKKVSSSDLSSLVINQTGGAQIKMPQKSICNLTNSIDNCDNSTPITVNTVIVPLAPTGGNGRSEVTINVSRSVSVTFLSTNGTTIPISDLDEPIIVIIPRDPSIILPNMALQNVTSHGGLVGQNNNNRQFTLHQIKFQSPGPNLTVSLTFELKAINRSLSYLIIYRFDGIPILNSTTNVTDGMKIFCPADTTSTLSDGDLFSYLIDNTMTEGRGSIIFGVRELSRNESGIYCPNNIRAWNSRWPVNDNTAVYTDNYYVRTYTSGCYALDDNLNWRSNGIVVGSKTNHYQTECLTKHLTTFAGGWLVLPAPINWNYVFANADFTKNLTVYLTLIIIVVLYIVVMIYARYKDKKDVEKLGVTPLPDNLLNDKYYYQILVFTGLRKDAGTKSKVFFILAGDDDETGTRSFADPKRNILQRGGIDSFIMAVPKSLGRLNYLRVWHDNSGPSNTASWFLKYIVIRDLQTMEKSHFICQQWLGVEKDDGMIDRLLPVAGDLQKSEFSYLLSKKTYQSMSDSHLWFSIFSRPPSTRFMRTQRCTCCFVLLFMSMFLNILYYDQRAEADSSTSNGVVMGPFFITPAQISIGIIVELICFLPSTILIEMFRRLRPRRKQNSPVRVALGKMQEERKQQQQAGLTDIRPQMTSRTVKSDPIVSSSDLDRMRNTMASPLPEKTVNYIDNNDNKKTKTKKRFLLPWWFIFVAYGISFLVFAVSAFFIWARGVEFGDSKTRKWLTSAITGFFSSILLTQPLKVVFLAIFFALIIRKDSDDIIDNDEDDIFLDGDEEYLHAIDDGSLLTFRAKTGHIPLSEGEVAYARDQRLKKLRMWEIIRELIAYSSFLWILYVVSYSNRDPNAFYLMQQLKKEFVNPNNATGSFMKIYNSEQYWDWLESTFVPRLRANNWYNGAPPQYLSGYVGDRSTRILGWTTMRQLRIKSDSCRVVSAFRNVIPNCDDSYSLLNEEKRSYYPEWRSMFNQTSSVLVNYSATINKAFTYQKGDQMDSYVYMGEHATYGGGGYIFEFRGKRAEILGNISMLHKLSWLDMQTRAVIIQMSLYNPNANLFVFVTLLAEFIPTGQIYPSIRVEPISVLNSYTGFALFKFICAILYMVFIIYYMQKEIRSMIKLRLSYFREFWSYPEIGIISCSWAGVGVYIWRIREGNRIGELFRTTNGYAYVNLQLATYVNDLLTFLLGFCCFFGTIKFLRLLRFNQRISMLSSTLAYSAKDLASFSIMFSVIYLGYLGLFFLLFHAKILACSDALSTAQMLFEMMLLKFDVSDLYSADAFLGPFCFTLFVIFVVFICMNMFISIIADAFRIVRSNIDLQQSEHEIVSFMINHFKKWTGIGKTDEMERLHLNPYDGTHVQYHDPITSFPNKMDELILALNKIYIDNKRSQPLLLANQNLSESEDHKSDQKKKKK